jgi:hypothetical protein
MQTSNILQHQVESCQESALQAEHKQAIDCRGIEDLISVGVSLFALIKRSAARWQGRAAGFSFDEQIAEAKQYEVLFKLMSKVFDRVNDLALAKEQQGYEIDGLAELKRDRREAAALATISLERLAVSVEQLRLKQSRPLGEVMSGLRDRHHAGSR